MVSARAADEGAQLVPELGPGALLDRYQLIRAVAKGGMGTIWLARFVEDNDFEKLVAIKTILPAYAATERFRRMLIDEAQLTARIRHRNVVEVVDLGDGEYGPYIVMEWIDGVALERACALVQARGEKVPLAVALRVVASACEALHAAHELRGPCGGLLGVVHRDASPHNVLLTEHGTTKVIDFGIARGSAEMALETQGTVRGTPSYMAPEQGLGRRVDRRADVWSLGAVLYRVLAGRPPFGRISRLMEFAWGRLGAPDPPSHLPEVVRRVIARAIDVDPDVRFPSAADMARAIEQAMAEASLFATAGDVGDWLKSFLPAPRRSGVGFVDLGSDPAAEPSEDDTRPNTQPMAPGVPLPCAG
jgi:eukaryotic-like serine/threonine-protein kinase